MIPLAPSVRRDLLAALAMKEIIASQGIPISPSQITTVARKAYQIADAMIAAAAEKP